MKRTYHTTFTLSFITLSSAALIGCATTASVPETSEINQRIPGTWSNKPQTSSKAKATNLSKWWKRFDDPVLTDLIQQALKKNTDIRSTLSAIRQARAELGLANAELWPSINGNLGASNSRVDDLHSDNTVSSENYNASIDASWEVDLFGQQAKYLEASKAELAASIEDFYDAQVALAAEVATTYLNLRSNEIKLNIVKENISTREHTLKIIQWQEQAGENDALSTKQSLSTVEQARAQVPDLEQDIEEIRNSLAILTGHTPAELKTLKTTAKFPEAPEQLALTIPANTLEQRPDIRSSKRKIDAAAANLSATELSRLPTLNLTGSIGIDAFKAGNFFDPKQTIANAIASLSAPIWDAGRISRNIEIQTETLTQAYLNYEATVLSALSEVENALSSIDHLNEELEILQRASLAASEATQLAQFQYESGESDLLTVLATQRTELELDQDRISTQAEVLQAHVELYKALGGGWSTSSVFTQL
ncbi:efflux transporter outer membrane subunit [Rubritalea spongiae]|uniref:Efflux transporter outer membrane subunit n=1 Tax=Rubritalea spongiae TaxID=430797 RepID=A0ABW5DXZ3_9BACT